MITLYSPVPPAESGPAVYSGRLLRDLRAAGLDGRSLQVVPGPEGREGWCEGFPCRPGRSLPGVAGPGETRIYFLANNDGHAYIHGALRALDRRPGARAIAVIHEPSCWMLRNLAAGRGLSGFAPADLAPDLVRQYGPVGVGLLRDFQAKRLPALFEYVTHMLGWLPDRADEIWVHSRFAALKLVLESARPAADWPRFRLLAHPAPDATPAPPAAGARFVCGLFGHLTAPKRVKQALRAFLRALGRLTPEDRGRIALRLVGDVPDPAYDPVAAVRALGLEAWVEIETAADDARFARLMAETDLLINLRFPSNGETSGTLTEAAALGIPAIATKCQAFHEAPAAFRVPAPPGPEIEAVAEAILSAFHAWRSGRPIRPEMPVLAPPISDVIRRLAFP